MPDFRIPAIAIALALLTQPSVQGDYAIKDLVDAAKRRDTHAVHKILELHPETVSDTDAQGYTALHWAGIRGYWGIFQELLEASAPIGAVGGDGGTPLHWTSHHDRPDMVAKLLARGADVTLQNRWGRTPLHVAARRGCNDVAALLLAEGANPNARTREGWTPLHVASRSGHAALVSLLKDHGGDPDLRDDDGQRAEDMAWTRPPGTTDPVLEPREYEGLYRLGEHGVVKIWVDDLGLRIREFAPDLLYAVDKDVFQCRQEPWKVVFRRNADNRVASVELHYLRRTVEARRLDGPRFVGSRVCQECHSGGPRGGPYVAWLQSRHAHAYWRLAADWALFLARLRPQYQDLKSPIGDHRCLLCHVVGAQDPDSLFSTAWSAEEGVGCEACHGPGSLYVDPEVMADRERFLSQGGIVPGKAQCRSCHRNSERFDFATWAPKIAHAKGEEDVP